MIGFQDSAPLTNINIQDIELSNRLLSGNYSKFFSTKDLDDVRHSFYTFKTAVWDLFGTHCDHGLHTLKFDLLDHLVEALDRFGAIQGLNAAP